MKFRIFRTTFFKPLFNQLGNFDAGTDYDMSSYMSEESADDGQATSEQPEGQADDEQPQSLEDQLNSLGEQPQEGDEPQEPGEAQDLLGMVNSLGMIRNGLPLELESEDQIRETIMKGMDYTAKTMELANERTEIESQLTEQTQALEERINSFEEERSAHYETLQDNQIFGQILEQVKSNYPDVFEEIQMAFSQQKGAIQNTLNNPVFKQYDQKINALESQLKGQGESKTAEQTEAIKAEWDNGLKEVQTQWGAKLKTLGIRPNWSEVQNIWKADSSKTMTVQNALLSVYGDKITKALESQKKLVETKAKSTARNGGTTNPSGGNEPKKSLYRGDEYTNTLNEIAKRHA